MMIKNYLNSRKFTWTLVGIGCVIAVAAMIIFPAIIPTHFNASGWADTYSGKAWLLIYPALFLFIAILTGNKKIKYFLSHSRSILTDDQYNWRIDLAMIVLLLLELWHLYRVIVGVM